VSSAVRGGPARGGTTELVLMRDEKKVSSAHAPVGSVAAD